MGPGHSPPVPGMGIQGTEARWGLWWHHQALPSPVFYQLCRLGGDTQGTLYRWLGGSPEPSLPKPSRALPTCRVFSLKEAGSLSL